MSVAEIADNKWEYESTKPPVKSPGSLGQIALIGGLAIFFSYIVIMSLVAIVGPQKGGSLADDYENLSATGPAKEEAAPSE